MRFGPTARGFAIIIAVAVLITASGAAGDIGLGIVFLVLQIAFIVAISIVLFRLWRRNREEIATWPTRSRIVFYGAATLALVDLAAAVVLAAWPRGALESLAFFLVLAASAFAMWRVWRDQRTYGY